jgi:hypothetical protein
MDCGLISQKGEGLTTKSTGFFQRGFFFQWKIRWTRSTIRGPWATLMHGGPWIGPQWWLTGARPSTRSGPWRLTGGGATERGLHGKLDGSLTRDQAARAMAVKKQWRRHSVRAALGRGEKRRRAGRGVMENGGALPLYRG